MQAMIEGLGPAFLGTSNCLIAMRREVEAIGTNAHELPMVYCALADNDRELAEAPYKVLADWQEDYDGNLRVMLPDTYGSRGFLERAPDWVTHWTGVRIDSGDPIEGGEIAIDWWRRRGQDPRAEARHLLRRPRRGRASSASTAISTAACASATAGARCSPTISAGSAPTAGSIRSPSSAR